jgi:hypothetical protein
MSIDNQFIRSAGYSISLTNEQITEYARCADPVTGYRYFMENYFYIQHPTKGKLLYNPYEFQVRLIDNYHSNRFSVSMMPRQTGKTTSAAGYLLWFAMFTPDSTILIAAHQYSGAQEIGHGVGYQSPHNAQLQDEKVEQDYLPAQTTGRAVPQIPYYRPSNNDR